MKTQILPQKTIFIVKIIILVLCLYSIDSEAKTYGKLIITKTVDSVTLTNVDSLQLVTKDINNNKFTIANQSPLELLQEKSSFLKRRFRETKYWSKSILWNESSNWVKKVLT